MTDYKTWANLKPNTPFNQHFPDGKVPIRFPIPMIPREEGSPTCYMVDSKVLTTQQIEGLAEQLWQMWRTECTSKEEAIAYIRQGLPLKCDWFSSVLTTDLGLMLSMAEMGAELKAEDEEDDYETLGSWGDSEAAAFMGEDGGDRNG